MPRLNRRALTAAALAAPFGLPGLARAQSTPLRLVLGLAADDPLLALMRLVTEPLSRALGRPVDLVPAPGEEGLVAAEAVRAAPADANTLMMAPSGLLSAAPFVRGAGFPFLPREAFMPVGRIAFQPLCAVVSAQSRFRSQDDIVAAERAQPGSVRFGTSGRGSPSHLFLARVSLERGLTGAMARARHFPGPTALANAVAAGEVDKGYMLIPAALPGLRGGQLRALYVATRDRVVWVPEFEAIPALSEAIPGWTLDAMPWFGLVARAGTPEEPLARIATALAQVLDMDSTRAPIMRIGLLPNPDPTPADFARFWDADIALQRDFARAAGLGG